jgi:hypothetical protein
MSPASPGMIETGEVHGHEEVRRVVQAARFACHMGADR